MKLSDYGLVPHVCKTVKVGDRFGRIVILGTGKPEGTYEYMAVYECDCGSVKVTHLSSIQVGTTRSCGCKNREDTTKHGLHSSPLYRVWRHMMFRCYKPESPRFKDYGGRGIGVCERWHDISNFYSDMFPTYSKGMMLDRTDNSLGYSPDNCKWQSNAAQQRNKRNNIVITIGGRTQVLQDWCSELGVKYQLAWERIKVRGWEPERALLTPARPIRFKSA